MTSCAAGSASPPTACRNRSPTARSKADPPPPAPEPLTDEDAAALATPGPARQDALARIMFPGPLEDYHAARARHGDVSLLPTPAFFYGLREDEALPVDLAPGVRVIFELEAISEPDENGIRTVMARVNGQLRPIDVRDRTITVSDPIERADPQQPRTHRRARHRRRHHPRRKPASTSHAGDPVAVIEAMKMESTISAPISGTIERLATTSGTRVERGDLLIEITPD